MSAFPKIIYGTAWKKDRTEDLVVRAVLQGFRAIDTACQPKHYREDLVGNALEVLKEQHGIDRSQIFLQTKFTSIDSHDKKQPLPYDPNQSVTAQVLGSFETSLKNLRTESINGYLLHGPLRTPQKTLEAWKAIVSLKRDNRVNLVGVSNIYDVKTLQYLSEESGTSPDIVQNRWYEGNGWDVDVVDYCKLKGIHYESFWTLTGSPSLLTHPVVLAFSKQQGHTPAEIIYRIAQQVGITPLAGSTNDQHMKEGVEAEKIGWRVELKAMYRLVTNDAL